MARQARKLRERGRLLSSLLQTPHDQLAEFRHERLPPGTPISDAQLEAAWEILDKVCEAIEEPDAARWTRVRYARDMLLDQSSSPAATAPRAAPAEPIAPPPTPSPALPTPPVAPAVQRPSLGSGAAPSSTPSPWAPVATPPPVSVRPARPFDGTMMASSPADGAVVLPFLGKLDAAPAPASKSFDRSAAMGQTAAVGGAPAGQALPFGADGEVAEPAMGLEHHAWFAAQCAAHPDRVAEIRASYHLDEAGHRALDTAWHARLDRDPALRQRWLGLFSDYQKKLGASPG